jgi:hypothetical protein
MANTPNNFFDCLMNNAPQVKLGLDVLVLPVIEGPMYRGRYLYTLVGCSSINIPKHKDSPDYI